MCFEPVLLDFVVDAIIDKYFMVGCIAESKYF